MSMFACVMNGMSRPAAALLMTLGSLAPATAAAALPAVGAQVGASAEEVRAAMEVAGCPVKALAVEAGQVAVACTDLAGTGWKVVIDPTTGRVTDVVPAP